MKVYYSGNFWGGHKYEHAGKEIPIEKAFLWGGLQWRIPAIYFCSKGLVIDFCVEIPSERFEKFFEHWNQDKRMSGLSEEDRFQMQRENPFSIDPQVEAKLDGKELKHPRMCAVGWHPLDEEREEDEKVQEELMEHYGCDRCRGWRFVRVCFPWSTSRKPQGKTLALRLKENPVIYLGEHFTTEESSKRQEINFIHPVTDMEHKLTIIECKTHTLPANTFSFEDGMEYPGTMKVVTYCITPELSGREFGIQDCARSDPPRSNNINSLSLGGRSACSVGIIGSADGPSAIFVVDKGTKECNWRTVYSSLHFSEVPQVEWQMMFYVKETEDFYQEIVF
ncbi:MAG: hypothetical protein K0S76_497 [Herbinix sp.]|jgi:hypothetical protein|nr:hypothetical protein [Herbinix sp.]